LRGHIFLTLISFNMKQKTTIMAMLWLLLVYSHQVFGSIGDLSLTKTKSSSGYMLAPPAAGFTYVASSGCVPVTVQFYSQLNGPSYSWTFGDGGTSSDCNPVHTYTLPGTYTVTLVATGGTYTTTITVGANPVVTLLGTDTVSCLNETEVYNISSTIPPASYSWSAQGGTVITSSALSATVKWTSYGVNYLQYTITTAAGCTKVFRFKIRVIPPPTINLPCCERKDGTADDPKALVAPPGNEEGVPGKGEPCSACAGSYNCYNAYIDPEFGLPSDYTWAWSVTNGTIVSISADSTKACVVWGASGTGTIKLVVTHKVYGCQSVKECEVVIKPGVTPAFTVTGSCINSPVNFDASGTTPIADVVSYFWEFGDGYTTTTIAPFATHEFTFTGSYTATLTITTKEGCKYKTKVTFNVISGTKPTIECPGTVCEKSRQCYSTADIPGATYIWNITGDIPADRVITGNKVCVTWGSGPVGNVSVTVLGGGYTCTNTASEAVAIVSSVIPIAGPDFICQTTGFMEVSTANYSGACYKWIVNGVAQSEETNKLSFNASAYGNPIVVEVVVDFPLGCCHGRGIKQIRKIPQYTMFPFNGNVCLGQTVTYNLNFPAGLPAVPVAWNVEGGTIVSFTPSSVTIKWDVVGAGTITAGNNTPSQYCNDGSNNTWTVNVWAPATGDDITGPAVVCGGSTNTYYHAWAYPTGSATVSVSPGGAGVVSSSYSSQITFPAVASPTIYTITVTYNHAVIPCPSSKTYTVKVMPNTVPAFSGIGGTICQGDIVTYTATIPDNVNYSWNVIGGSIISEVYSAPTLTIQVQWNSTVTSSLNITNKICNISGSQPVTVNGKPVVLITTTGPTCPSPSVTMRVAPVWSTYSWFGPSGGGGANTKAATIPGVHGVTVSNGVCSNTGTINIPFVTPTPPTITGFTVTPTTIPACPRINVICPNITPGSGPITSYNWTFSGFTTTSSSAACPAVSLPASGAVGTWTLTVTDAYLCTATRTGTLTETCTPAPPCSFVATFGISYDPCTGQFTSSGTNYTTVDWLFGDGTIGSGFNPVHFYSSACTKNVTCYVTDINGCVKVFNFPVNVPYTFVGTGIAVANSSCTGASTLTATGPQICAGSGLTPNYFWTVTPAGGGSPVYSVGTGTVNNVSVGSMPIPNGNYTATVTITIGGCTRTFTTSFNKGGLQAYFVSCGGCAGSPLTFLDQSTPYTAPLIKWNWVITGPAGFNSALQNPTILFNTPGTYNVSLTVTDNVPCTNTFTANIVIQPAFNPGDIRVNTVSTPSNTTFNICPTDAYTLAAPPGGVAWTWSTGETTSSINVTGPGDYYVTVFNASNCAKKIGPIKFLYKPAPEAIILSSTGCSPSLVRAFTGTGYSYTWATPIGGFSGPSYFYLPNPGGLVNLTVTNLYGCSDAKSQNITVYPSPIVSISVAPTPFCPGNTANLTANVFSGTPPFTYLWNNGSMASAISVNTPGLYKVNVVDMNGCPGNTSYDLQPATPPGMDLLPRGCYDVCTDQVTFCTGRMPWGWTGQWHRDGVPYGPIIPENGNMAIPFSGSGTYVLHYNPVNPAFNCPAKSNPIIINMAILPAFTITPSSTTLCTGGSVILTANPQNPDYTYTWYFGGSVVGAGFTHVATQGGTYTLVVSQGACCSRTVSITIEETNCCFDGPSVPYTSILTDSTIAVSQFWGGKYYIDAVVTVVGSAVLDLTNIDIVFGPNGTIRFLDNSFLRCNNSVLRPCAKDDIWKGISFHNSSSGWINTTTIKNAIIGVLIDGNVRGVRITDNSFIKCQVGVSISKSDRQQSISGNTFETDPSVLQYPGAWNQYWGIRIYDSRMEGIVAQNDFRHTQPIQSPNYFFGIYSEFSNGTFSENRFNDMYRSIDVTRNRDVVAIEKNDVKVNYLQTNYDKYQYRITFCELPVLVYENIMDNGLGDNTNAGAIYTDHTVRTHMKDNKINGFMEAIMARSTSDLFIASNEITSSYNVGIFLVNTSKSFVSCNTIKGSNSNNFYRYGIVDLDGDGSTNVFSNCIFDMNTAMYFRGDPSLNLGPIYNNYMYNYDDAGIFNRDYSGFIGMPGSATDAGRNTFMSNNGAAGFTFDINSTWPITEDGNFGIQMTNNTSTSTGTDRWYSTAACGQQIEGSYRDNMLDRWNVCDVYYLDKWLYRTAGGQFAMRMPTTELTAVALDKAFDAKQSEVLGQVAAQIMAGGDGAQRASKALLASKADRNMAALLITNAFLYTDDVQSASNVLASQELAGIDKDLRQILQIVLEMEKTPGLTNAQRSMLKSIDDLDHEYSPLARDIIQASDADHDYKFRKEQLPTEDKKAANNINSKLGNTLSVYPVPASEQITVTHNVNTSKVQGLKVFSAAGMEVTSFKYTVQSGSINIDISTLASGIYSVVLITDNKNEPVMTGRFVKVK
jgi:PKD repeat protein